MIRDRADSAHVERMQETQLALQQAEQRFRDQAQAGALEARLIGLHPLFFKSHLSIVHELTGLWAQPSSQDVNTAVIDELRASG